jgi:hypothetical protein
MLPSMFEKGLPCSKGLAHESGCITGQKIPFNFNSRSNPLNIFHSFVKCLKSKPVLLALDNHSSHVDYKTVSFAKEHLARNNIAKLPPLFCPALQTCDISFFGSLKVGRRSMWEEPK